MSIDIGTGAFYAEGTAKSQDIKVEAWSVQRIARKLMQPSS